MMKKISVIFCLAVLIGVSACKKNEIRQAAFTYTEGNAFLKVNFASPNFARPGVVIKVNGERVSNNIIYNTPFPGGGLNTVGSSAGDYITLAPGKNNLTITIPKAGSNEDSIPLLATELNLTPNVFQTLHVTDTSTKTTSVLLTDLANRPDSGISKFRFINLIPDSKIDLLLGTTVLATGIDYKQATDTFSIASGTAGRFTIRRNGQTTALAGYPTATTGTYTIPNQRVMTIYCRGYLGTLAATDPRIPNLSLLFNK
jgi:hypothetical protein